MKIRDTWDPARGNLAKYLDNRRRSMDETLQGLPTNWTEGTAWSTVDDSFSGLEIKAQTFVEYTMAEDRQERWVEVCEGWSRSPPYIPVAGRKNPEEYRVHDDSQPA